MSWEHFEIEKSGNCKVIEKASGSIVECEYSRGIVTTGKSREFWGYQILVNLEGKDVIGKSHIASDSYSNALIELNSELEHKGSLLLVAGNADGYSESAMSGGVGYGYIDGHLQAVDILSFYRKAMKSTLIYLHGFNSASQDESGDLLLDKGKLGVLNSFCEQNGYRLLAPNLDYQNSSGVVDCLLSLKNQSNIDGRTVTYMGTSLGGFFSEYMAMITHSPSIIINPANNPSASLKRYIGPCQNYANRHEYIWTQENCDAFEPLEEELLQLAESGITRTVLLDMGDELLNSEEAIQKYSGRAALHTFEGGSHRFDHLEEALPIVKGVIDSFGSVSCAQIASLSKDEFVERDRPR